MKLLAAMVTFAGVFLGAPHDVAAVGRNTLVAQDTAKAKKADKGKEGAKPKKDRLAKLVAPWPDSAKKRAMRDAAQNLPLFKGTEPVVFTLIANYKALNKDRDTLSTKRFAATLIATEPGGKVDTIPVKLRSRGHWRLMSRNCAFVPIRVEFPKKEVKGTIFEGQSSLKLGTHCQSEKEWEQYTLREYAVYRIQNLVTPMSFRARLAKATYVDSASGKELETRVAMFVENEDDLARRMEGRIAPNRGAVFDDVELETATLMAVFEYMIANTDWSLYVLHNVRLIQTEAGEIYPIAYDFDFSGLVHTRYAIPDPKIQIKNVRERIFRGPCRTATELEPTLALFRSKKAEIMAVYDSVPDLDAGYRKEAREYLDDFFRTISRPNDTKGELIDNCSRKGV
jgi:hypothetical protein